ncbi:RecX family transcriptional regulator [Microaerobacter geothermalis]|uniref:regulatory protein RecX n=1 Tax=Microaerobacter geothermalis TaxID=674972 RepID=UPI001F42245F|nr:RecX family transcriptional regulator [Microaerobacter geothermalis]MCF6093149.1 RecX family transcriptional regulator [Microaerobacter geothermalis]
MKELLITSVIQDKNNNHRYHLYANEEYMGSVHEDIVIKYRLIKGKSISDQDLKTMMVDDERHQVYLAALKYLGYRPRTEKEVMMYLIRKGYDEKNCRAVMARLIGEGYINDEKYAEQWIKERMMKKKGSLLLKKELLNKGIQSEIVEQAVSCINKDKEYEQALSLAEKKITYFSNQLTSMQKKKKLGDFLLRRGFSYEMVQSVIDRLL